MSSLPEDIYLDILLKVPEVKSLLVCKCVCKPWFSIVSDPDFVKRHLDFTTKTNKCCLLIKTYDEPSLYLRYDSLSSSTESDNAVAVELQTPCKYLRNRSTCLLGSCNGLVYGWDRYMELFFLWNPATKEYRRLPQSPSDNGYRKYRGFGYDYKTDDYKLVEITGKNNEGVSGHASVSGQLYSLKSNSWRRLQSIQYNFQYQQGAGVMLNGTLHWFGGTIRTMKIVSMDISEETFEELELPIILPTQYYMNMGVLEECLCVLVRDKEIFEVWVMQDYKVPESWTKLYTITYESIFRNSFYNNLYVHVELIGSFKNGEILFVARSKMISYDSRNGTVRKTEIDNIRWGGAMKYSESLVSLNSNTVVGRRKKRDNKTKKRNR